jgi:hypothetical protein
MKGLFLLIVLVAGVYFFYQGDRDGHTLPPPVSDSRNVWQDPIQKNLSGAKSLPFRSGKVKLLAEYDITARIILKKYYNDGMNAEIAPLDLAVGWKRMSDPNVYGKMAISQANRFFNSRWSNAPPLPHNEISLSIANMHIIAANRQVEKQLESIQSGHIVTLKGYLVYYRKEYPNGGYWEWKSSLSRNDQGQGACELMYVEYVIIH